MTIKSSVHDNIDDNNEFIVHIHIYYGCSLWIKKKLEKQSEKNFFGKKSIASFFSTLCILNRGYDKEYGIGSKSYIYERGLNIHFCLPQRYFYDFLVSVDFTIKLCHFRAFLEGRLSKFF